MSQHPKAQKCLFAAHLQRYSYVGNIAMKMAFSVLQKKPRLVNETGRGLRGDEEKQDSVVLCALFFDKFNKQLQVFRIHIGQNTVAKVEHMA